MGPIRHGAMFDQQFSDLHYIKINLTEVSLESYTQDPYQQMNIFKIVRKRPFYPNKYRVNIWGYFNTTPINRVN